MIEREMIGQTGEYKTEHWKANASSLQSEREKVSARPPPADVKTQRDVCLKGRVRMPSNKPKRSARADLSISPLRL